ncbi:hypothetical protein FDP41_005716 [Naegleria fowleri]|uniref:Uncharacterized protein n=1 Tax=Naegleria fowleri TaxID=5763 RepID=A0A6A5BA70_NAEFO|nr:uncharacterized protein FDP41_005716 [Naegleria fowleri]KAF0974963.1 hypothetical protein FDP41_005716 [Naegleria fowleri]
MQEFPVATPHNNLLSSIATLLLSFLPPQQPHTAITTTTPISFTHSSFTSMIHNNYNYNNINNNTNSTSPSFNLSSVCHPFLFQPGLSREWNGTYEFGLCPDTYSSFALCLILVVAYVMTVGLSGIGIFWKRQSGHVKARDPLYLEMTCVANFVFVVGLTMRIVVGRKLFPCGLLTVCFFILPPAMMLPTVFRLMRLYLMYRINLKKMKLFESPKTIATNTSVKEIDPTTTEAAVHATMTIPSITNTTATAPNSIDKNDSLNHSKLMMNFAMFGQEDISHRQELVSNVMNPPSNVALSLEISHHLVQQQQMELFPQVDFQALDEDPTSTDNDSETMADISTWRLSEVKDFSEVKKEIRNLKIMNFFVSYKFILLMYGLAFVMGVAIWLLLGTIEEVIYNSSQDPNKKRIFLLEGGMLVFDRGCGFTTTTILIVGLEALFYIVIEVIFLILSFFADRDTWSIKKEALILIIFQLIAAVIFIVVITEILLDYLVPTGLALWVYNYLEVWICVTLPVIYAIRYDARQQQQQFNSNDCNDLELQPVTTIQGASRESGLEKILKNK